MVMESYIYVFWISRDKLICSYEGTLRVFFFFSFELRPFLLKHSLTLLSVCSAFEIMVGNCESACVGELFAV